MEPSRRPGRWASLLAATILSVAAATGARADIVLSDNTAAATSDTSAISGDTRFAASFATDASSYSLTSVSLLLARTSIGGSPVVDIYRDGGLEPGSILGTLTSPDAVSTAMAPATFGSSGLILDPNATYWVVLRAPTGSFNWGWTADNTGSGAGFRLLWSESDDAGNSWFTQDSYPFQMTVSVAAVPEPSSMALVGLGGVGLAIRVRRKPVAVDRPS